MSQLGSERVSKEGSALSQIAINLKIDSDSLPAFQSVGAVNESNVGSSAGAWLLDRVDDVGPDLFVALQL